MRIRPEYEVPRYEVFACDPFRRAARWEWIHTSDSLEECIALIEEPLAAFDCYVYDRNTADVIFQHDAT